VSRDKKVSRAFVFFLVLLSGGCTSIRETGTIPQEYKNVAEFGLSTYCGNLTNTRRILLRFIRAVDPQWTSVCEQYWKAKEVAAAGVTIPNG
jgi:hypothetical protein